ncbi:MAG: hypothetical protein PHO37_06550, partial [Kiritimatiellae bacterium]|nr:hypothetical protein [Kiritimatiellia bacterium]
MSSTFLSILVSGLFLIYLSVNCYKSCVELMRELWLQFRRLTIVTQISVLCVLSLFTNYGGAKFPRTPQQESVPAELRSGGLVATSSDGA